MYPITDSHAVEIELGRPLSDAEEAQAEAWAYQVEGRIRRRVPDLDSRVESDSAYAATLMRVVAAVVARKLRNPDGMRSERIDDYYYDRGGQSADLTLTDEEWADVLPAVTSGAFTVRGTFVPDGC